MNPNELKSAHNSLELFDLKELTNYDKWIAAIQSVQLNAFKAGMTEAAEIAQHHTNNYATSQNAEVAMNALTQEILTARDRKDSL